MSAKLLYAIACLGGAALVGCEAPLTRCGIIIDNMGAERFRCKSSYAITDTANDIRTYSTILEKIEKGPSGSLENRVRRLIVGGKCTAMAVSPDGEQIALALCADEMNGEDSIYRIVLVESKRPTAKNAREGGDDFYVVRELANSLLSDNIHLFRIERMDLVKDRLAVLMLCADNGWKEVIRIFDCDQGKLISTCGPNPNAEFDMDLRLSPDHYFVALYGGNLVPRLPRSIDLFYPYSQKCQGYLAVWRVQDGTLIKELDKGVFVPDWLLPLDDLRIKKNNSGRSFRISKFFELGWAGTGGNTQVVLPDGALISLKLPGCRDESN